MTPGVYSFRRYGLAPNGDPWLGLGLFLSPCEYGVHSLTHTVITYMITYFLYDYELGTIDMDPIHPENLTEK